MAPLEKFEDHLWECGGCRLPWSSWSRGEQAMKGLDVRVESLVDQKLGTVEKESLGPPLEFGLGPHL